MSFREFDLGLRQYAEEAVPDAVRDFRDAIALEVLNGVVYETIYDTGRARGNWQVTAGTPAEGYDEDMKDQSGAPTVAKGEAVIARTRDPYMPIWLHNGVPYIGVLEYGRAEHGRPAYHMVERTVARIVRSYG